MSEIFQKVAELREKILNELLSVNDEVSLKNFHSKVTQRI